ncbi:hypothetical protein Tco_0226063 [Tanacetum coccineum]
MDTDVSKKQTTIPSFTDLLQNSVRIDSNTITRQDGRVQSFCGLRLTETPLRLSVPGTDQLLLPDTTTINTTQVAGPSTCKYASTRRPRKSAGPLHLRPAPKKTTKMAYTSAAVPATCHNIGPPTHQCRNCNATMWYEEREEKSKTAVNPSFSLCCQGGKVLLPRFNTAPPPLNDLLSLNDASAAKFRDQIRDKRAKLSSHGGIDEHIVASLIQMLNQYSSVAKAFRMARDWSTAHNSKNFHLRLHSERKTTRQYNAPTVSEVAALIVNDFEDGLPTRDIIVTGKDNRPKRVSELHPSYMALQYPLLFP